MAVRAHLTISGRVQGVWYRGSMQEEAHRLGIAGWVRNRPDGTVEAEIEGEPETIEELVAWARRGPRGARVTDVDVQWLEARGERGRFVVRG